MSFKEIATVCILSATLFFVFEKGPEWYEAYAAKDSRAEWTEAPPFIPAIDPAPSQDVGNSEPVGAAEPVVVEKTLQVTESIDQAFAAGLPVLVYFKSDGCRPCGPFLDALLASEAFLAATAERCTLCIVDANALSREDRRRVGSPTEIPHLRLHRFGQRPTGRTYPATPDQIAAWLEESL